jgi:hypothetical protein
MPDGNRLLWVSDPLGRRVVAAQQQSRLTYSYPAARRPEESSEAMDCLTTFSFMSGVHMRSYHVSASSKCSTAAGGKGCEISDLEQVEKQAGTNCSPWPAGVRRRCTMQTCGPPCTQPPRPREHGDRGPPFVEGKKEVVGGKKTVVFQLNFFGLLLGKADCSARLFKDNTATTVHCIAAPT